MCSVKTACVPPVKHVIEAESSHREGRATILWQSEKNTEEKNNNFAQESVFG